MTEGHASPLGPESRQKTIDVLSESFARDEIDVEEFEQRVELVGRAQSLEHLKVIVADLPQHQPSSEVARVPTFPPEHISGHSAVIGILGGGRKEGNWVPARRNWAACVLGGCELDFRDARLGPGVTDVHVLAILGGVQVWVPPNVRVECSGVGILGGFDHKGAVTSSMDPDAPVIRVSGGAILGGVEVTVRYPGETKRDVRLRLKAQRKALKRIAKGK